MAGTLVAGELIKAARDEHPSFDDRRHPDPVLLRALSRYQRELLARIIRLDPSQAVAFFDQPLPLAVFENGIAIPAYKYPLGVEVLHQGPNARRHPIELVEWAQSARYHMAAYLLNGILFLCGSARDWTHFVSVRFLYVPEPDAIAIDQGAMETVLEGIPDAAEMTLVSFLAAQMARRGGGEPAPDAASFSADWVRAEDRFFDEMARNTQAVSSVIRDVM